ncbi:hypothetical protein DICPUDRAFT_148205 [Dictyostelium purpureum]|uniref:Derlin n=1 Tax=Dictyostelium purpureum TaxID=5786 RepID=F0ZAJ0_DICPU|nr:uncharacterized protein DICPUDRAFT_148205 [Dictyostelium purpureum]EGC39082.1 hypothetical protein DICPUDRAFT_148205 [Dictyostelium purpureum]|eukprot:XP_003284432.1 hypothetical protein DICPUDRAFT_148205 [Dictyostelium purpureum]
MSTDAIKEWWTSIPIISRWMFAGVLGIPAICALGLISPYSFTLSFAPLFKQFQIWRLITSPVFIGTFGPNFLFPMIFFYQYSTKLESQHFQGKTDDFLFLVICVTIPNIIFGLIFNYMILGTMTTMSLIYMYSRYNANSQSSFFGFFSFKTVYLPWIFMLMSFLTSGALPVQDFLGVVSAHIYYYLTDVYPRAHGKPSLIKTPRFISNLFKNEPVPRGPGGRTVTGGYNWGQGRALG